MTRLRSILLHIAAAAAALWVLGIITYCLITRDTEVFYRPLGNIPDKSAIVVGFLLLTMGVAPLLLYAELKRLRPQLAVLHIPFSVAVATWFGLWCSCVAITVPWMGMYPNLIPVSLLLLTPIRNVSHPWFFHALTALNLLLWPPLGLLYDKWRAYQRRMTGYSPSP